MDVFFITSRGKKFSIELGYWDTVLDIKKKIEKYQRIPVSEQTLIFNDNILLQDDLCIEKCKILHNSQVQVFIFSYDNDNPDQDLQTEQSPIPSNRAKQIINNGHQDSTVMVHQQQENITIQDSHVKVNKNKKKRILLTISVLPCSGESKAAKNLVYAVNTKDPVKILRNEWIQTRLKTHLNRPQDGYYFFTHKGRILNEDWSFECSGIDHTGTIEIIPDPWHC